MSRDSLTPTPPTSPWQRLYGTAHRWREAWYRRRADRLPRPVISLGNLHWGGTGKTPLTASLAAWLRDQGQRVCILSRGYGGGGEGVRVVSRGEGPLLGPSVAGDEPVLLADALPGVAVVVEAQRYRAGLYALERLEPTPDLFLLDDGFSHLALARDLDLLVLPAADPFAGGRLPPSGRLREPLASARRAHGGLVTGAADNVAEVAAGLAPFGFTGPVFAAPTRLDAVRRDDGTPLDPQSTVVAVAAIAGPGRFYEAAEGQGFHLAERLTFGDHHPYPEVSLRKIRAAAQKHRADVVLTTEKDAVKLRGRLELPLAYLPIRAEPEAAFWEWLGSRLAEWKAPPG
ncbi:MAG: tetraacyldisaccharide 4'-kinase [Acidobacteriota bacterium]